MIYNGVTEYLHRWCMRMKTQSYEQAKLERERTGCCPPIAKRWFFDEMAYKLLYLVDEEHGSYREYLDRVRSIVRVRKCYMLKHETNPVALKLLEDAEREFLEFVGQVKETDTAPMEIHCRVVHGDERERLEYDILEKWDYCAEYWYPLKGDPDEKKLFLNVEYLEPYWQRLCRILGVPGERVYEYGESFYEDGQLLEVDVIEDYCGNECAYLPKDLSWIIYFSHEDTVTFAGSILPKVRELLAGERDHWNQWN